MSGVELKEYFDTRISNIEKATGLAYQQMERRLEGMNEFRNTLKDQSSTFLTRDTYEAKHKQLEDKIDSLQKYIYMFMGAVVVIEFLLKFLIK